ncbi:hypothetical protein [Flavobacterium oreochromis]|uniref:Type VI secretion system baseplate subunit TssG n=2 Tax=Flavobacterium TaxID=237 RepID=A0A246GDC1_9FLAO|nr:hypothetical protein [Flavobacterium oreochromis]OWP78570.1 hypothetical protein BWG23_02085 [Flavobacterium oreochromis]OWP79304.1 hypothetical protein BWK62_03135 [Flavobacterium oreochromis]POR24708.1 hypothetical protein BWK58_07760 [Flavobacterium columnare]
MTHLNEILSLIRNIKSDIRAEVIVNDLLANGIISDNQFIIQKESQFSRAYRRDILEVDIKDFNLDKREYLNFTLSRDSLYDLMPEGVFHQSKNEYPDKGVNKMISEYQTQKKEEKAARAFFQPFENEFFAYGVSLEDFETNFLLELNNPSVSDLFYQFWGITDEIPDYLASKLIHFLPYTYQIVGNIGLATDLLSFFLNEKVAIINKGSQQYSDEKLAISLGDAQLGIDFISGVEYDDYSLHLEVQIGPLKNSSFLDYILDGKIKKFLDLYYEYFFPMETDLQTHILIPDDQQNFEFTNKNTILGYNTII